MGESAARDRIAGASRRGRRAGRLAAVFLGAVVVGSTLVERPDRALRIGTGTVAHGLCSATFVSGLDPDRVFADALRARIGLGRIAGAIRYDVDRARREATAHIGGAFAARAVFYDGLGCVLIHGEEPKGLPSPAALSAIRPEGPPLLPDIAGPDLVEARGPMLEVALAHAFEEPVAPPYRRTKAVVVVHAGRVVAERYAPGYSTTTPVLGLSMTKAVTSALVGVLVQQGRLSVDAPAPVGAWQAPTDPRRQITLDELLRMTSGLDLDEHGAGLATPSDRMLYLERDMSAFAERAPLIAAPGTRWAYSSASTHLVAQIIRETVGGSSLDALAFAQRELFGPLGIRSALLEVDATGTMIGAHYMFASARDWARFGLLYLEDGVIGGRRLLPEGWVERSARATLDTDYGAGFWTNRSQTPGAKSRVAGGMPADAFFAAGNLGQRIVILPSQATVIVRLGDATGPDNDMAGLVRLVREVDEATARGER